MASLFIAGGIGKTWKVFVLTSNFASPFPSGTLITTDTSIDLDPNNLNVVYMGGTSIARSASGSVTPASAWTLISPTAANTTSSLPGLIPVNEIDGDAYYAANPDAGLYRFDYVKGQRAPKTVLSTDKTDGARSHLGATRVARVALKPFAPGDE